MKAPCMNCTKRYPACQDTCADKAAAEVERKKLKEKQKLFFFLRKREEQRNYRR